VVALDVVNLLRPRGLWVPLEDSRPIDRQFPREFRGAYEHASRWIELFGFNGTWSQHLARHVGHLTETIRAAVMRQMGDADPRVVKYAVMFAIDDAIKERKPRC
jgi:hypothetical protein